MFISKGIIFWLLISSIIVYFDAFYVIMRPETLSGGKYYYIFKPYELYVKFDTLYGMNNDPFVIIQSWLNAFESTLTLVGIILAISSCQIKQKLGGLICLVSSTMVFWKTIIFVWYDRDWLTEEALNYTAESILCYYLPSYCWIVFPFLSMVTIGKRMIGEGKNEKVKKV